jgi:hypothetical protein
MKTQLRMVRFLIYNGADVNANDADNLTPLTFRLLLRLLMWRVRLFVLVPTWTMQRTKARDLCILRRWTVVST